MPRKVIDSKVRDHLPAIRKCYEDQLNTTCWHGGKVVTHFVISGDGSVSTAMIKRTALHNVEVEQCLIHVLEQIRFPEPKGEGIVIVNYPFVFKMS